MPVAYRSSFASCCRACVARPAPRNNWTRRCHGAAEPVCRPAARHRPGAVERPSGLTLSRMSANCSGVDINILPITVALRPTDSQGQLLEQRSHRKLLQQLEERARARYSLCDPTRGRGRLVRIHRDLLQPEASPLHTGLQVADSVPQGLAQRASRSAINGGIRAAAWRPKSDEYLTYQG